MLRRLISNCGLHFGDLVRRLGSQRISYRWSDKRFDEHPETHYRVLLSFADHEPRVRLLIAIPGVSFI